MVCLGQLLINFSSAVVLLTSSLPLWVSVVLSVAARGVLKSPTLMVYSSISSCSPCQFLFHVFYSSGVWMCIHIQDCCVLGTSLVVQWLRLLAFNAGGTGSSLAGELGSHMPQDCCVLLWHYPFIFMPLSVSSNLFWSLLYLMLSHHIFDPLIWVL